MSNKKSEKLGIIVMFCMLMSFGLVFIIVGKICIGSPWKDCGTTTAKIVEIDDYFSDEHYVYVDYTIDGKDYEHILLHDYSSSMKVGKTIKIYYDEDDHKDVRSTSVDTLGLIFCIIGGVEILGLFIAMIKSLRSIDKSANKQKTVSAKTSDNSINYGVEKSAVVGRKVKHPKLNGKVNYDANVNFGDLSDFDKDPFEKYDGKENKK